MNSIIELKNMTMQRTVKHLAIPLLALCLQGCLGAAVGAAVDVTGEVIKAPFKLTGAVVGAAAQTTGAVVGAPFRAADAAAGSDGDDCPARADCQQRPCKEKCGER